MTEERIYNNPTPILSRKPYVTFQGCYRVKVREGSDISIEDAFSKCILYVVEWIKERVDYDKPRSGLHFLNDYPPFAEYKSFYKEVFEKEDCIYNKSEEKYDIGIFASRKEKAWTIRIEEPDNGKEDDKYPARLFITDVGIKLKDDNVYIAGRVICNDTENMKSEATAWRPVWVRAILGDEELMMFEGGVTEDTFHINGEPIFFNSKSSTDSDDLFNLINAKNRQLPIILCPYLEDGEFRNKMIHLAGSTSGVAYVFIEDKEKKDYTKLYINYGFNGGDIIRDKMVCILPDKCNEDERILVFDVNEDGEQGLRNITTTFTVRRDGRTKKPKYNYGEVLFYKELKTVYIEDIEDAVDLELIESLQREIEELKAEKNETKSDKEIDKIEKRLEKRTEALEKAKEQSKKRRKLLKEKGEVISDLKKQIRKLEKENNKLMESLEDERETNDIKIDEKEERIGSAIKEWDEAFPQKKEEVIAWLEEKYSDTVLIHKDAKRAYDARATQDLPISDFCDAFGFLDCYARVRSGKLSPKFYDVVRQETRFEVTPHNCKAEYAPYYISVNEDRFRDNNLLCDLHIKRGSNNNSMFRIYFAYVPELEKVVVGSMPDHLRMGPNDQSGRDKKVH